MLLERTTSSPLLKTLHGAMSAQPPIWLMRQAGRYLPEYRAIRANKGNFLDLVFDPETAADVTLQPIRRFGFDAAILFSDILVIPHALGQKVWFETGEGPRLAPRMIEARVESLIEQIERLAPIYQTIRIVRAGLSSDKALLGFAGSPWTVATYMLNGAGSKDQSAARSFAYDQPAETQALLDAIISATIRHLKSQIDAGVDAVQLFESWAGTVASAQFERLVIAPNSEIVQAIKAYAPHIPIIGFPRGAGGKLSAFAADTGVDAVGLDETVDPIWADRTLPKGFPVQGNLDPLSLRAGGQRLLNDIDHICAAFRNRPHIFNLGHGILPDTPLSHVEVLVARLRGTP